MNFKTTGETRTWHKVVMAFIILSFIWAIGRGAADNIAQEAAEVEAIEYQQEQIEELTRENQAVQMEIDILKKDALDEDEPSVIDKLIGSIKTISEQTPTEE